MEKARIIKIKIKFNYPTFWFLNLACLIVASFLIVVCTHHVYCWVVRMGQLNQYEDVLKSNVKELEVFLHGNAGNGLISPSPSPTSLTVSPIEEPPIEASEMDGSNTKPLEKAEQSRYIKKSQAGKSVDEDEGSSFKKHMPKSLGPRTSKRNLYNKLYSGLQKQLLSLKKVLKCTEFGIALASCSIGLGILQIIIVFGPVTCAEDVTKLCGSYFRFWILAKLFGVVVGITLLILRLVAGEYCDNVAELSNGYPLEVNIAVNVLFILYVLRVRCRKRNSFANYKTAAVQVKKDLV